MNLILAKLVLIAVIGFAACEKNATIVARPKIDTKIIGGESVMTSATPWMVSIGYFRYYYYFAQCGGTLIDSQYVLTTASCCELLSRRPASEWRVVVGVTDFNTLRYSNLKTVEFCRSHENYNTYTHANDIAVMKLAQSLPKSSTVDYVCLDSSSSSYTGKAYTLGWGITNNPERAKLQGLQFCALNPTVCESYFSTVFSRTSHICTGDSDADSRTVRKDICFGDGGGPLFTMDSEGQVKQIGIASYVATKTYWGYIISACDGLSGFTRVATYQSWIESKIGKSLSSISCKASIPSNFIANIDPVEC